MTDLGTLKRVDLKEAWEVEAQHFTPWLAKEENLSLLAKTLDMELELQAQEKSVGPFRADILCKDAANNSLVLIENQLARTNHSHVGQLITYAAGLQAVTIVWVAGEFTNEHRAALDWLNEISHDNFRFFGLEIELWKIDDSRSAPKFNIVSIPNDWSRSIRRAADSEISERERVNLEFWTALKDRIETTHARLNPQTPSTNAWTFISIGRTGFTLRASISSQKHNLQVALLTSGDSSNNHFNLLKQDQTKIEEAVGEKLDWTTERENGKQCVILLNKQADPTNLDARKDQVRWIAERLERFDIAFRDRVKNLDASEWVPEEEAPE